MVEGKKGQDDIKAPSPIINGKLKKKRVFFQLFTDFISFVLEAQKELCAQIFRGSLSLVKVFLVFRILLYAIDILDATGCSRHIRKP